MQNINNYILEKLKKINSKNANYIYSPHSREELRKLLEERLKEDKNADLNDIDVSNITNMNALFYKLDPHNIDISEWDVSNVEDMGNAFYNCLNFNSNLSKWDVSKVEDMFYMFYGCKNFNSDLNRWDVSNVQDMRHAFYMSGLAKNPPNWYKYK